jgi:hypothetical protein
VGVPWYAAWDLAFHCVVLSLVDAQFAKDQLVLMLREWYMHPNGQIPAYEWNFGDVNPPVHAWAAMRVYQIEKAKTGKGDRAFLERVFHKLLLNFDWWVNRKDALGNNIFQGGFLGLDNIGIFDRNMKMPEGWVLSQADGTSWMAMYCLNLLGMALELASEDPVYEDVASKFWEHFVYIAHAIQRPDDPALGLWDEEDGFFYDEIHHADGRQIPIRVRSLVGLLPLTAVVTGDSHLINRFPAFKRRMEWFFEHRQDLTSACASMTLHGANERILMSVAARAAQAGLAYMLDESEFSLPTGSARFPLPPTTCMCDARASLPLPVRAGRVAHPLSGATRTGGARLVSAQLSGPRVTQAVPHVLRRLVSDRVPDGLGKMMDPRGLARLATASRGSSCPTPRAPRQRLRAVQSDPHWKGVILFHEYSRRHRGRLGASHQTGWTGLVAKLLDELLAVGRPPRGPLRWPRRRGSPALGRKSNGRPAKPSTPCARCR